MEQSFEKSLKRNLLENEKNSEEDKKISGMKKALNFLAKVNPGIM